MLEVHVVQLVFIQVVKDGDLYSPQCLFNDLCTVYTFVWHEPYSHHFLNFSPSPDIC